MSPPASPPQSRKRAKTSRGACKDEVDDGPRRVALACVSCRTRSVDPFNRIELAHSAHPACVAHSSKFTRPGHILCHVLTTAYVSGTVVQQDPLPCAAAQVRDVHRRRPRLFVRPSDCVSAEPNLQTALSTTGLCRALDSIEADGFSRWADRQQCRERGRAGEEASVEAGKSGTSRRGRQQLGKRQTLGHDSATQGQGEGITDSE